MSASVDSINQSFVDGFRDHLIHLTQQTTTKLRGTTDQFSPEAETGAWDRLSAGAMAVKARDAATPAGTRDWTRRIAIATPYNDSEITEVEDPSMMLIDPNSNLVQSMGMSAGRQFDDIILAAADGNAVQTNRTIGTGDNSPTNVALPAGQILGTGAEAMSFDLVAQTQRLFMDADIDPSEPKVFVVGPTQVYELMQLTEQTSSDYVNAQALQQLNQSGIVANWMGFTWIMSTRLIPTLSPATGQTHCLAYTVGGAKSAIGLHVSQDITTFVKRDPSHQYAWRPYCQFNAGAVRIEEPRVVRLHLADASAP